MPPDDGNAGGGEVARPTVQASSEEARERNRKRMHEQRRSQGVRPRKAAMSREDRLASRAAARAKRKRQAGKANCAEDGDVEEEVDDDQEDDADAGDNNSGGGGPGGGGGGGGGGSGGGAGMTGQGSRHSKRNKH